MNDLSTRDKILKRSHKLFADNGFNGVSIREIAKVCDVNVAAINYHFKNKENLYTETVRHSIENTQADIKNIFESLEVKDVEVLAIETLKHFMNNAEELRTSFKLVLSSDPICQNIGSQLKKFEGPPGGEFFYQCLRAEIPIASEDNINWGVRVIFSHVIHKAIVMCNNSICESMSEIGLGKDVFLEDLRRLVKVVKKDIL